MARRPTRNEQDRCNERSRPVRDDDFLGVGRLPSESGGCFISAEPAGG